jgi:hypothetical protein
MHEKKKAKNYAVLIVLLAIIALFFFMAMVKMSNSGIIS